MPARESRDGREYLIRCRRIVKLYDRWRKSCRVFNRDFAVFLFFFFFVLQSTLSPLRLRQLSELY